MSLPFEFSPTKLIEDASRRLTSEGSLSILDLGCHIGRNSSFLAGLGHTVIGITDRLEDAQAATQFAVTRGVSDKCHFVAADIRALPLRGMFDVVLMNEVLHLVTHNQARSVITNAQAMTRTGGLHITSGYVVDPNKANAKNRESMFWPNELHKEYKDAGWRILAYQEDPYAEQIFHTRQLVHSKAYVIAQKEW